MLYIIKWFYAWLLPPGLFLLVALAMLFFSYKIKKKPWLVLPLLVIYLLSIRPVSNSFIKPLESCYVQPDVTELETAQAIVLLGGGSYEGVKDFDGEGQRVLRLRHEVGVERGKVVAVLGEETAGRGF